MNDPDQSYAEVSADQRYDARALLLYRKATIYARAGSGPAIVRNISAAGLMAQTPVLVCIGDAVTVELASGPLCGMVRWAHEGSFGMKFAEAIRPLEVLRKFVGNATTNCGAIVSAPSISPSPSVDIDAG